jgi:hypothetical protein
MARQGKTASRLARAGKAIKNTAKKAAKKVTARLRPARRRAVKKAAEPAVKQPKKPRAEPKAARPTMRPPDIPLEVLERTYIPKQTSLKSSFRSTGEERQRDQRLAELADERFNDEDHFTNKSGDPRIGTHHRKYEPEEKKEE